MSVWLCIPSARSVAEVNARMDKWIAQGYRVLIQRDPGAGEPAGAVAHRRDSALVRKGINVLIREYRGYAEAVNFMVAGLLRYVPDCDWIVAAGDDTDPDPTKRAEEIARECSDHFRNLHIEATGETIDVHPTFGIMQPTGDPWSDRQGRIIERIAGSPWLGREWCRRAYGGKGPLWPEFYHCFGDEHLQNVAIKIGIFWQRPDLTHHHDNWARKRGDVRDMPEFLRIANSPEHWRESKAIFERLKAGGFAEANDLLLA